MRIVVLNYNLMNKKSSYLFIHTILFIVFTCQSEADVACVSDEVEIVRARPVKRQTATKPP